MSQPTGCPYCGATTNKRTGEPLNQIGHAPRCPKRPSATDAATVETATVADTPTCDGGKSMKSPSPTVAAPLPLSSSLEEEGRPGFEPGSEEEKKSVTALWAEHKFCREPDKHHRAYSGPRLPDRDNHVDRLILRCHEYDVRRNCVSNAGVLRGARFRSS